MMRKSAKFLGVVLSVATVFTSFAMTACGAPDEEQEVPAEHTHTYAATWEKNDTQHWHAATCEHTDLKSETANHNTTGANGSCSVCGYAPAVVEHVHTFFEEWESDSDYHWHQASCEHFELIDGKAAHNTDGENGACSECGYASHKHTFDTSVWKTSSLAHWHSATCEGHELLIAGDSDYHDYNADFKCTVCDYQHNHPVAEYPGVDATGHWDVWDCEHQDVSNKINFQAHNTNGDNGACTVCGWLPIVETATDTNKHTHTWTWEVSPNSHWKRLQCGINKLGCKSCDKGYYAEQSRMFDMGAHTYGDNGACTVCGFTNTWRYESDDCLLCDDCGGCIKTVCAHEKEDGHKKCGDERTGDAFTLEAEEGEVWGREDGKLGSIVDYRNGKRECIHAAYSNVGWTIHVNKATKVTLRIHCGRTNPMFSDQGSVVINDVVQTTKTPCAQPSGEDAKCNPGWLTFGCVELKEGTNRIEVLQVGKDGFHLDKIELITDDDVQIDYTPINNTWLYEIGQWVPIPRMAAAN